MPFFTALKAGTTHREDFVLPYVNDIRIAAPKKLVGPVLDPPCHICVGGAAVGWVVLEAAILGGLCDGVITMPSARCSLRVRALDSPAAPSILRLSYYYDSAT